MSFASLLVHDLTLVHTPLDSTVLDDYGQPAIGTPVETAIKGMVQPRNAREKPDPTDQGAEIADTVIYIHVRDIHAADAIVYLGDRYEIKGVRHHNYGTTPHIRLEARRVGRVAEAEGS